MELMKNVLRTALEYCVEFANLDLACRSAVRAAYDVLKTGISSLYSYCHH